MRCRRLPRPFFAAAMAMAATLYACSSETPPADTLSPDLRARVEKLKSDVAAAPTTAETLVERAEVLWEWTNAFALAGGVLPVNLTTIPAGAARVRAGGETVPEGSMADLDAYVHELAVKEADPRAVGEISVSTPGPLAAGSFVTFEQTYTVGTLPLAQGGVILVAKQFAPDQGRLQHSDPAGEAYVKIRASTPAARFEPVEVPLAGMHGGFRGAEPMPAFRLSGAALEPGDSFTVVYGDRSGGSPGFRIQSYSTDQLLLPIYVDLEGNGNFFTPRWPRIAVEGGSVEAVSAIAPSVVAPGESFALRVRSEDRFRNRATGPKPAYRVLLDGAEVASIPAGGAAPSDALATVPGLSIEKPGVYRFEVRAVDAAAGAAGGAGVAAAGVGEAIATWSNPLWVDAGLAGSAAGAGAPRRVFWGETHGHTGMSEGQGSPGSFWTWARDDARLDFAALSEHDVWLDDYEWSDMQRLARESIRQGGEAPAFVAILGYEWTSPRAFGGHHNVFFRSPDRARVGVQTAPLLADLYRGLHAGGAAEDVLVIPHAHQAGDWTQNDAQLERLVEIYSMHGTFEWFGNMYLRNGFEVGFVAASDDHRSRPGYAHGYPRASLAQPGGLAAVIAPEATTDAIFDGLRGLSAYATSGPRILLDATLNGQPMGTRQADSDRREIAARVSGTAPIDHVDVVKNGEVVWSRHFLQASLAPRSWLQIGFESSSDVLGQRDNPRGYRVWQGAIEVAGARVVGVEPLGFDNLYGDRAAIDPENPSRVEFHTETRGRRDTLLIELDGVSTGTIVTVRLEPTREYGASPALVRRYADIPGEDVTFALSGLVDGRVERELRVGDHVDSVRLQVVDPQAPLDQAVTFADMDPPQSGDYYYVRVTQLDGGRAWSSPFWVGALPAAEGGR